MEKSVEDVKDEASFLLAKDKKDHSISMPSSDNGSNTNTIMAQLTIRAHVAQTAKNNLESKISSSVLRYFLDKNHNNLGHAGFLKFVFFLSIMFPLIFGSMFLGISFDERLDESDQFSDRMVALGLWLPALILSPILCLKLCLKYRRDVHRNHENGIFDLDYERFKHLLPKEVKTINRGLVAIGHIEERININADGHRLRFFSKILADGIKKINSTIEYNNFMRHSLFNTCHQMPSDVKNIIFDYALVENLEETEEKQAVRLQIS